MTCQSDDYAAFVAAKSQIDVNDGFAPTFLPSFLFPFQSALVDWAVRKGRAALFEDCGLGKTAQQLVWAENVVRHTNRPVLLLTPLAVAAQTVSEATKFGLEARRGPVTGPAIYVTNYERLHHYDAADFAGVACDESSILKNFEGATRAAITEFMRRMPYRLLATATAAPNDYIELGTSSEALGHLGHMDMLNRFFKNENNNSATGRQWSGQDGNGAPKWRLKGHAHEMFWRWVTSWARAIRKPSDLGFEDGGFALPPLVEREHVVAARKPREGFLFSLPAHGLSEQREERRRTLTERCEKAAELVANTGEPAVCWCNLNDEADLIERLVPDAVQVSGTDSDDEKEAKFAAFSAGEARVMVIKPVIGAWGLNWQHCAHQTVFAGYSFEQYYQGVRRSWRFGQTRLVTIEHVVSDGEREVLASRQRKAAQSAVLFGKLVEYMREGSGIARGSYGDRKVEAPSWLRLIK